MSASTESNKELLNAIESREKQPTYINLSEVHRNDDLIAIYKNCLRQVWNPSVQSATEARSHISWNNIRPPSLKIGIKDVYIENETIFVFTVASDTAANIDKVRNGIVSMLNNGTFKNDINAALYNTQVAITGQTSKGMPFIDLAINRFYNEKFYDPAAFSRKCDKNVFYYVEMPNAGADNTKVILHYHCASPFLHPMFSSENDIAGISALSIDTDYNLWSLLSVFDRLTATTATASNATTITSSIRRTEWRITYNQTNYSKDLDNYATLCTNNQYYTQYTNTQEYNAAFEANMFNSYIGEVSGAPISQYLMAINDIAGLTGPEVVTFAVGDTYSDYYKQNYSPIKINLSRVGLDLNGNQNIYNTQKISDIYHCCKKAGYLGSFNDFTCLYWPSVYGFSSLQYNNKVSTTDTYSLGCSNYETIEANKNTGAQFRVYWVYQYPALFFAGNDGDGYTNTLGAPLSAMIKSESDIDEYLRQLEAAGYSGGSLWSWLKNLKEKLKKGRYISSAAKAVSNVLGSEGLKTLSSMIPTFGPAISAGIDKGKNLADRVQDTAEKLGYGVSMF